MARKEGKLKRVTRFLLASSLLIGIFSLAAFAAINTQRFSNIGATSGQADGLEPGGDRFNSYAWTMETMENSSGNEFLYVGTNRDIIYALLLYSGVDAASIEAIFGEDVVPTEDGNYSRGRILRKRTNGIGDWEQVYSSDLYSGYRGVISFEAPDEDQPSLYFATQGMPRILKFGPDFQPGDTPVTVFEKAGASLRSMTVHNDGSGDRVFAGVVIPSNTVQSEDRLQIWANGNPSSWETASADWERVAWMEDFEGARVNAKSVNCGGIWDMISFNGWLYAFIGNNYEGDDGDGFMVFKGRPAQGGESGNAAGWHWAPVVSTTAYGQGKAAYPNSLGNPSHAAASPFHYSVGGKDYVYVGTFADVIGPLQTYLGGGPLSVILNSLYPCQVYRFDTTDKWEMVIGNPQDSSGVFGSCLGNFGAGFFNPPGGSITLPEGISSARELSLNQYAWRMGVYNDKLFVTTFDMSVFLDYATNFVSTPEEKLAMQAIILAFQTYNSNPAGFDLYYTEDGVNFSAVTTDGFGDKFNYGGRTVKATDEEIFFGTANPFYGCQVWKLVEDVVPPGDDDDDTGGGGGGGGCSGVNLAPFALLLLLPMLTLRRR